MKTFTLRSLAAMITRERNARVKQVLELQQRVLVLEQALRAAQSERSARVAHSVVQQMRAFLEEERARDLYPAVKREVEAAERRLLEQLRPHLVDVNITYKGPDGQEEKMRPF